MISSIAIILIAVVAAVYLGFCLYALLAADKLIFPRVAPSYEMTDDFLSLDLPGGGAVPAYHKEVEGASHTLLYFHGNGEDIGMCLEFLDRYVERGVSVFAVEYPGYGRSTAPASEAGTYLAAEAAYAYLTEERGWAPGNIVFYGRSLGGGPSTWLAANRPNGGLIIDCGFTSAFRVRTGIRILPWDRFDNLSRIGKVRSKVLIIHGVLDKTVPLSHGKKLLAAAGTDDKHHLWIETTGHHNIVDSAGTAYWDAVLPFFRTRVESGVPLAASTDE